LFIEALKIVSNKHPNWKSRIYWNGTREELQAQIASLGLLKNCIWVYSVPNIVKKYVENSIFVSSSCFKGFGMVLRKQLLGIWCRVSFACPCGLPNIIKDAKDGLLVENENIEQPADRICYLIEHETIRKEMRQKVRINVWKIMYLIRNELVQKISEGI
jgi:glycosyltransferase involved in cell wall biosynthesis